MPGVDGEEGGGQRGRPGSVRGSAGVEAAEQSEDQGEEGDGVGGVEREAGEVVSAGVEAEGGVLGLEEEPGEGLIGAEPEGACGPGELVRAEAAEGGVLEEVLVVVPVDEAVVECGEEGGEGEQGQRRGGGPRGPSGAGGRAAVGTVARVVGGRRPPATLPHGHAPVPFAVEIRLERGPAGGIRHGRTSVEA